MIKLNMASAAGAGIKNIIVGLILGGMFGMPAFSQDIIPYLLAHWNLTDIQVHS